MESTAKSESNINQVEASEEVKPTNVKAPRPSGESDTESSNSTPQ